jgi:hypothetical protein
MTRHSVHKAGMFPICLTTWPSASDGNPGTHGIPAGFPAMLGETLKPVLFVVAAVYIAIDELFSLVSRPIAAWLARQDLMRRMRRWITSLSPYPALALFIVPLAILEPVKPVAAWLAATGHFAVGAALFVGGELLKLVLVERLFQLNKHKLMSIAAFAWCYVRISALREWLEATAAFRTTRRLVRRAESALRELTERWMPHDADDRRVRERVRRDAVLGSRRS